jgi:hypothetical protein
LGFVWYLGIRSFDDTHCPTPGISFQDVMEMISPPTALLSFAEAREEKNMHVPDALTAQLKMNMLPHFNIHLHNGRGGDRPWRAFATWAKAWGSAGARAKERWDEMRMNASFDKPAPRPPPVDLKLQADDMARRDGPPKDSEDTKHNAASAAAAAAMRQTGLTPTPGITVSSGAAASDVKNADARDAALIAAISSQQGNTVAALNTAAGKTVTAAAAAPAGATPSPQTGAKGSGKQGQGRGKGGRAKGAKGAQTSASSSSSSSSSHSVRESASENTEDQELLPV